MGIPVDSLVRISTDPGHGGLPFTDFSGALVDPTTVTLTVQDPTGVKTIYTLAGGTVVRDSAGIYHVDVDSTGKPGVWSYEWKSTGVGQAAFYGQYTIDASPLG